MKDSLGGFYCCAYVLLASVQHRFGGAENSEKHPFDCRPQCFRQGVYNLGEQAFDSWISDRINLPKCSTTEDCTNCFCTPNNPLSEHMTDKHGLRIVKSNMVHFPLKI